MECIQATISAALYPWREFWRVYQINLDKTVIHLGRRWLVTAILASIFALRVIYLRGFYAVAISLSIYVMDLFTTFLTPIRPLLPIKGSDEFQPFIRKLSEFHLWYAVTKAYTLSIMMTFFSICDAPLIWPYLLAFSLLVFIGLSMAKIFFFIKFRYLPITIGKEAIRW